MSDPRAALERDGYLVLDSLADAQAFERLLGGLGTVMHRARVELRSEVSSYLCQPAAVPLHTDHPEVDVVAWWCERQDPLDGTSQLVDAAAAIRRLSAADRRALSSVMLPCPELRELSRGSIVHPHPVLAGSRVYFAAWLEPLATRQDSAWSALVNEITDAPRLEIRLRPGQALLIDNHRMLHGRRALASGSRRQLWRAWIAKRSAEMATG